MTVYTLTATDRKASQGIVAGKGDANNLRVLLSGTVELAAAATGSTVTFGKIPSNARISALSRVYCDDLATTGAPIMDFGLNSDDVTADPDAIGNGQATLATASVVGYPLLSDAATIGVPAWDLINGQTTDPKNPLTVYGTLTDAATTATGTITVEVLGYLD